MCAMCICVTMCMRLCTSHRMWHWSSGWDFCLPTIQFLTMIWIVGNNDFIIGTNDIKIIDSITPKSLVQNNTNSLLKFMWKKSWTWAVLLIESLLTMIQIVGRKIIGRIPLKSLLQNTKSLVEKALLREPCNHCYKIKNRWT